MRGNFELTLRRVGSLDSADIPVVGRQFILNCKRKGCFKICRLRFPVDYVTELDTVTCVSCRKTDRLNKFRIFGFALHLKGHAHGTSLDNPDLCCSTHERSRRSLLVLEVHVPRGPLTRVVC